MRILIVDDELVSREKLRKLMSTFGRCILADNGKDALQIASSQNPPDIILIDIMMPGMDGYEVCKELKAKEKTSNIPIIFISGKSEEDDESRGFEVGAVDYIRKPFSPSIVKARVQTHLELKRYRDRLEELVNERTLELNNATKEMQAEMIERKRIDEERKILENQLHRAQKMESLGIMAGGIAHDLNNILSGIVSYPDLLLMDIPMDSPLKKPIESIKEAGMRAVDVVSDLLTITRGVAINKDVLNLNMLIAEYLGSAEHRMLEETNPLVTFKAQLESGLLNIRGSDTHIRKTLLNLVLNAAEAIEESGTVGISTGNRYLDEPLRGYEDVRQGEYAVLTISDTGCGISTDDLERVFEPFYSKKVMGRSGTGLGLAIVWNTVQDHDGYINVNSGENGTVFDLYFPVTRKDLLVQGTMDLPETYLGRGETILVVDDEERQREITAKILTKLGYNARAVSSGEEAVEHVKNSAVDLIVLDMIMPKGINGLKTYQEIIKIRPGQKAIIASGYAKTQEVRVAQKLGAGRYIRKPYTLEKIGIAVKKELEK